MLLAMREGQLVAAGAPKDALSAELIRHVFGIDSHVMDHPVTGQPMCLPIPNPGRPVPAVVPSPA